MKNAISTERPVRNASLDIVRIAAIAAVVMIHVSAEYVDGYGLGSREFFWGNVFDSLSRIGVSLFIMVSGALLLDENRQCSVKDLFIRRIPNLIFLLVAWSAIYALRYEVILPLRGGWPVDIRAFAEHFLLGHLHLWYLYMQIGLYLALPFLRLIVCKKNQKLVLLYIVISMLTLFMKPMLQLLSLYISFAENLVTWIDQFNLVFFNENIAYFLLGWYLVHVGIPEKKHKIALYGVAMASVLAVIVYVNFTHDYSNVYSSGCILIFLYAAGAFLALINTGRKLGSGPVVSLLAKCSFGIYVVHLLVLDLLGYVFLDIPMAPIYLLVRWTLTFAASFLIVYVLSKIPYCKKLVRM